jgi:hypothetical protein
MATTEHDLVPMEVVWSAGSTAGTDITSTMVLEGAMHAMVLVQAKFFLGGHARDVSRAAIVRR